MDASYCESLDYLYSLQLFGIKLGLENIRRLLARLDNPQRKLRIIHIAGTNGKGSTAAALANIFQAADISVGLYTSPHLHSFTERIRVASQQVSEAEVVALIDELRPHAEDLRTTFFEFTTAMALLHFQRSGVEWAILETGLGGRLDATNVVDSELCLITPIALDHTAYLGNSLAEVAAEKAGIFKQNVPVISARQSAEVEQVLRAEASRLAAPLLRADCDYRWYATAGQFSFDGFGSRVEQASPGLIGTHQQDNLALALAAAAHLCSRGLALSDEALRQGVEQVRWPGRLEWLPQQILLDGAHNVAGAKVLADYLREQGLDKLHLVVGFKADKQSELLLQELLPFVATLYATSPPVDEAVSPDKLVQQARMSGILSAAYVDPQAALAAALSNRQAGETLLIAGSLFLVAAVRELLLSKNELLSISA